MQKDDDAYVPANNPILRTLIFHLKNKYLKIFFYI